jgi:HEAT repeat protein
MSFLLAILLVAGRFPVDLNGLQKYEAAWSEPKPAAALVDEARAEFGNRGVEVADYFLKHTEPRPRNDAYFFVLRAVGDTETALVLIRALPNPPTHESGTLDRHFGEVEAAIRAVLETNDPARADPRIVSALLEAVATARAKPYGTGMHITLAAIGLLGLCRSTDAAKALQVLAANADAQIRTAVANALGRLTETPETQPTQQASPVTTLLHILKADPNAEARRQAAESLGGLNAGEPNIVAELRSVLSTEKDPQVVDAIIQGLYRQGAPIQDPGQCRELIARAWDAFFAKQMLDCWRVTGTLT